MDFLNPKLLNYCEESSSKEQELLYKIDRETNLEVINPRMISGHLQGRFLSMISKLKQPKVILEIGTYTGYSALCLAEGMSSDGKLITLEKNKELEPRVRSYFDESDYGSQMEIRIGNALEIIPTIEEKIDLIFIDADKANYVNYLSLVKSKLNIGGLIIADNVLWSGKVIEELKPEDKDTTAILEFNKVSTEDPDFENVLLPLRDGLMILRKIN